MSSFSPTDAALEGVRLTRERPKAILAWSGYNFAFGLVLLGAAYLTLGPHAQDILSEVRAGTNDPAEAEKLIRQTLPFCAVGLPLSLLFMAMQMAAVYRAVLKPGVGAGRFRLGREEWRLVALILVGVLIVAGVLFLSELVSIVGSAAGANSFVIAMVSLAVTIYLFVRLSLAGPASFAEGRLLLFRTWLRTRGNFWRLLGAYVMAMAILLVVLFLMTLIFAVLFGVLDNFATRSTTGWAAVVHSPLVFLVATAGQVVNAFMSTCCSVIFLAPFAQAYRELTGRGGGAGYFNWCRCRRTAAPSRRGGRSGARLCQRRRRLATRAKPMPPTGNSLPAGADDSIS